MVGDFGGVAQRQEATDSKPVQCEFESHRRYMAEKNKKIKMKVDEHLNAGVRVNHDRRRLREQLIKGSKKVKIPMGKNWGGDGDAMGNESFK